MRGRAQAKVIAVLVALLAGCGGEQAPVTPDVGQLGPVQMIDEARDIADQVEERYDVLDQP